jgi:DnaK suppressor protein
VGDARQQLLDLRDELLTLAEESRDDSRPVELDQQSVGRLSRMDAMQMQSMAQATVRRRQDMLARIDGALRRLDSGEFGLCFVCGEEIADTRLAVDPTTTRCIKCADA